MRKLYVAAVALAAVASLGAPCNNPPRVFIDSPLHGTFHASGSVLVNGRITMNPSLTTLTLNGSPVTVNPDKTFSATVILDPVEVFNRITAQAQMGGAIVRSSIVVVAGGSVADGGYSLESLGLRITDPGLDQMEPVIESLVDFNLATLLPLGSVVINNECFIPGPFGTCLGRATVTVQSPAPSISGFGVQADSQTNFVHGDIAVNDLDANLFINGTGLVPDCGLNLSANTMDLDANFTLEPKVLPPDQVDVAQTGPSTVSFQGFDEDFEDICDLPIIGDIIQAIIGDVEPIVVDGLQDFLDAPNPQGNTPVAGAIETALAGIEIAGPIGEGLDSDLQAPLFQVAEDVNGITLGSHASVVSECTHPPGAPNLLASYDVDEPFPPFPVNTPVNSLPFDIGLSISTSAFNQLLKSQVECGLLLTTLTEVDLEGTIFQITAAFLGSFVPAFNQFPPATPFRIEIAPKLAPILTGNSGPGGELAELRLGDLQVTIVQDQTNTVVLAGGVEAQLGLEFDFVDGELQFLITPPPPTAITATIETNVIGANVTQLEQNVLPFVISALIPSLAGELASFPIPDFLDLSLTAVELGQTGEFLSLYADLAPAP